VTGEADRPWQGGAAGRDAFVAGRDINIHLHDDGRHPLSEGLDRLPPGMARRADVEVYLATLIDWLNTDPWAQDKRFGGPVLTPAVIERKLSIASGNDQGRKDYDADELGRQCRRLVVLGGPGSGKTWLAKRTARLCAEKALREMAAGARLDDVELPLYTTCARLALRPGDDFRRAVVSSALGQLPDLGGARVADAVRLLFEDRSGPTLLVSDSLDEAHGADERLRSTERLPPAWRVMLTSRPASWNGQLDMGKNDPARRVGDLQPLRYPEDVESFIACWFTAEPARAAELAAQLRARPDLQQAVTVPLLLTFCCIIGGDQPLPGHRGDLYAKVIRRMLTGRWRGSGRDPEHDPDGCLETLCGWAWSAAASDPVSGVGDWADEFCTPRAGGRDNQEVLDHVAVPLGPPDLDTGMSRRRFVHRSVHEHLAARYVSRMPAEKAAAVLLGHVWYDPDWEYAAPAALAMHRDREQVLREMVRQVTGGDQTAVGLEVVDGCWEFRRFLARVAHESSQDDWSPEAASLIGQARTDLIISRKGFRHLVSDYSRASDWPASDWPTSNRLLLEDLLTETINDYEGGLLPQAAPKLAVGAEERASTRQELLHLLLRPSTDSCLAGELAEAIAGLDPTAEERAATREALLLLLAGTDDSWEAGSLAEVIAGLDPTAEERVPTREALLRHLLDFADMTADGFATLAKTIAGLAVGEEERAATRQALLHLVADTPASQTVSGTAEELAGVLARTIAGLAVGEEERAETRQALLHYIPSIEDDPLAVRELAEVAAGMAAGAEERAETRQELLRLLLRPSTDAWTAQETDAWTAQELAEVMARLDPTVEERATARQALLRLLTDTDADELPGGLAEVVARLAAGAEERAATRQALHHLLLLPGTDGFLAEKLAGAVAGLDPTAEERTSTREALLRLLTGTHNDWSTMGLARMIARLAVGAEERAAAREALLRLLADTTDSLATGPLAKVIVRLDPTAEERTSTRQALLRFPDDYHFRTRELTEVVVRLAVGAEDRAAGRQALLRILLLPSTQSWTVRELAEVIAGLAVGAEERAATRHELLRILADTNDSSVAWKLAEVITRLDPAAEERPTARQALLRLLANANSSAAWDLAGGIAGLGAIVTDLNNSRTWPEPPRAELLAAARRNSELRDWISALPLLSRCGY
jgi:hypothetical protein